MARLRISAVAMLVIALFGTGAWVVVRTAVAVQPPNRLDAAKSAAAAGQAPASMVDRFVDLLPKGARARMGTIRFRHGDGVSNALYTPQGHLVVSVGRPWSHCCASGSVHVWDAATGRKLREIGDPATNFLGIALSPDGSTLATSEDTAD